MTQELASTYISLLYANMKAGRITAEEARAIEDEVLPRCERCGLYPQKVIDESGLRLCSVCDRVAHSGLLFH